MTMTTDNVMEDQIEKKTEQEEEGESGTDFFKTIFTAVALAMLIRIFAYEPFNIPTGSMIPTLLVGDHLFVSKYAYGYSQYSFPMGLVKFKGRIFEKPVERGDIVVFRKPTDTRIDYIKRIVGLPGDRMQMKEGRLYINGELIPREYVGTHTAESSRGSDTGFTDYIETLPNGLKHPIQEISDDENLDNTQEFVVPKGYYFGMGDNRDDSTDSRDMVDVGFIPAENLIGKAEILFFSTDGTARLWEFWKWPFATRYSRILDRIE